MPVEPARFFSEQLERAQNGLAVAIAHKNVQLAALNLRQAFRHRLMLGLLTWRQGSNPTNHLASAVNTLSETIPIVQEWDAAFDVREGLPLATSALLEVLVAAQPSEALSPSQGQAADERLDLLLAQGTTANPVPARDALQELRHSKRTHLAAETYQNYLQVLASKGDQARLEAACRLGESLFAARSNDSFYSGGHQTEGGGQANELVVDYRLATVLKLAQASIASKHAWRW